MIAAFAGLEPHFAAVEGHMARILMSGEPKVDGLITDLGTFHGKLLRPALVLLVARSLGGIDAAHQQLGAALELIHTATLIHDDLIDDADVRRNRPTAHVRFGNTTSVLLGDYFYTHAFSLVATLHDTRAMERLVHTTNVICRGELHQQVAADDTDLSEAEYRQIIYGKTACLTELAAEFGARGASETVIAAAATYGRCCGMAFQIVDDCLDFTGDPQKVGKSLATDAERGRMTLPIIRLLGLGTADDRRRRAALVAAAKDADGIAALRLELTTSGALAAALDTARADGREAHQALEAFPAGAGRDQLRLLADFIVARDF
jgi:octaprenyl-diphosphate synthase